jgi:prepilin-type N-terminal cleavage/methylation domain-containing protein
MKKRNSNYSRAFTLIEMMVVIAIIGILAVILVPAVARAKLKGKIAVTKVQINELENAIKMYKSDYSRFPVPKDYPRNQPGDFSVGDYDKFDDAQGRLGILHVDYPFGGRRYSNLGLRPAGFDTPQDVMPVPPPYMGEAINQNTRLNNSDVMKILMSEATDQYPATPLRNYWWDSRQPPLGANYNHLRNPKKRVFINLKPSGEADSVAEPGLSENGIYRDPFGNQFNISMDLNGDGFCTDPVYSSPLAVKNSWQRVGMNYKIVEGVFDPRTGGVKPLAGAVKGGRRWISAKFMNQRLQAFSPEYVGNRDYVVPVGKTTPFGTMRHWYARKSEVMVWTAGPDGMASVTCPVFGNKGDKDYDVDGKGGGKDYNGDGIVDEEDADDDGDVVNDDNILGWK